MTQETAAFTPTSGAPTDSELSYIAHLARSLKPDRNCHHCHGTRGYSALAVDTSPDGTRRVRILLCCGKPARTEYMQVMERLTAIESQMGEAKDTLQKVHTDTGSILLTNDYHHFVYKLHTFWGGFGYAWKLLVDRLGRKDTR